MCRLVAVIRDVVYIYHKCLHQFYKVLEEEGFDYTILCQGYLALPHFHLRVTAKEAMEMI